MLKEGKASGTSYIYKRILEKRLKTVTEAQLEKSRVQDQDKAIYNNFKNTVYRAFIDGRRKSIGQYPKNNSAGQP